MDNNRNYPDSYYNYGQYNEYQNYSNATPSRNENLLPRESYLKGCNENKAYYKSQENFQNSYSENQFWNMQARSIPNSSYSTFPSPQKQNLNQSVVDSLMQNKLSQKHDLQFKGNVKGVHNRNNLEGIHRNIISEKRMTKERIDAIQRRTNIPQSNYRLPSNRSNENSMLTLCGGEPVIDLDDSQYYLINDRKQEQESYGRDKNLYDDDYNDEGDDDEIIFQDYYNSMDSDMYEPSIQDVATFDPRERANKPFQKQMQSNSHSEKLDGSSYSNDNNGDYYIFQQQNAPSSSQGYNQNKLQNLHRSRNLMHPSLSRQEMYKQMVSEKLNETFNELKNAGLNDKNDQGKSQRNESFSGIERYKYQDLINENSKRSAMMSHLNKYSGGNDNEQISKRQQFILNKTKDVICNTNRNIQMRPEEQKFKNSSLGQSAESFVSKHKEYQNSSSVPGCCVDVFNNYRKEKIPDSMLNTQ